VKHLTEDKNHPYPELAKAHADFIAEIGHWFYVLGSMATNTEERMKRLSEIIPKAPSSLA